METLQCMAPQPTQGHQADRCQPPAYEKFHLGKLWDWKGWQVLCSDVQGPSLLHCSLAVALMQASVAQRSSERPAVALVAHEPSDETRTRRPQHRHIWGVATIFNMNASH